MNSQLKRIEIRNRRANLLLHCCKCYRIKKWQCKTGTVTNVHVSYLQNLVSCWSHGHLFAAAALTSSGEIWWCQGFVLRLGYQEERSTAMSPGRCLWEARTCFTPFTPQNIHPLEHEPVIVAVLGRMSLKIDSCTQHAVWAPVIILALRKHLFGGFLSLQNSLCSLGTVIKMCGLEEQYVWISGEEEAFLTLSYDGLWGQELGKQYIK